MIHPSTIKADREPMAGPVFVEVWEKEDYQQECFTKESEKKMLCELDLFDEEFLTMTEENSFL